MIRGTAPRVQGVTSEFSEGPPPPPRTTSALGRPGSTSRRPLRFRTPMPESLRQRYPPRLRPQVDNRACRWALAALAPLGLQPAQNFCPGFIPAASARLEWQCLTREFTTSRAEALQEAARLGCV